MPEQLNPSSQQTSLVPSSTMRCGVGVSMMSVAELSSMKKRGNMDERVSVALLSMSKMCSETEPGVSTSQTLGRAQIAKPVTETFANIKVDEQSTGNSPLKRKNKILNNACTLVPKFSENSKSNLQESERSESPAKRRKVKCVGWGQGC